MPAERAMLESALDRLAVRLRGLAGSMSRIDALEAYLDLARPLVDECEGQDRLWVNARIEDIWSDCPLVAQRQVIPVACDPIPAASQPPSARFLANLASLPPRSTDQVHAARISVIPRRH